MAESKILRMGFSIMYRLEASPYFYVKFSYFLRCAMIKREQLLQELEHTSDDVRDSVLEFLRFINAHPAQNIDTAQRIDTLESVIGNR